MVYHFSHVKPAAVEIVRSCFHAAGLGLWLVNHSAFNQEVARDRVATVFAWGGVRGNHGERFPVDRIGAIAEATGGFGAVFAVFAGLLTFALSVAFWLLGPRGLQPI